MGWQGTYDLRMYCDKIGCTAVAYDSDEETGGAARNNLRMAGWEIISTYGGRNDKHSQGIGITYCPEHASTSICSDGIKKWRAHSFKWIKDEYKCKRCGILHEDKMNAKRRLENTNIESSGTGSG